MQSLAVVLSSGEVDELCLRIESFCIVALVMAAMAAVVFVVKFLFLAVAPMVATARNRALFRRAEQLAARLGMVVDEAGLVGGASDANFTSELTATLDGLGALGDGAHAADEHVVVSALPDRAALLALLLLEPA